MYLCLGNVAILQFDDHYKLYAMWASCYDYYVVDYAGYQVSELLPAVVDNYWPRHLAQRERKGADVVYNIYIYI
jgi:hypothetical protein